MCSETSKKSGKLKKHRKCEEHGRFLMPVKVMRYGKLRKVMQHGKLRTSRKCGKFIIGYLNLKNLKYLKYL